MHPTISLACCCSRHCVINTLLLKGERESFYKYQINWKQRTGVYWNHIRQISPEIRYSTLRRGCNPYFCNPKREAKNSQMGKASPACHLTIPCVHQVPDRKRSDCAWGSPWLCLCSWCGFLNWPSVYPPFHLSVPGIHPCAWPLIWTGSPWPQSLVQSCDPATTCPSTASPADLSSGSLYCIHREFWHSYRLLGFCLEGFFETLWTLLWLF